VIVFGAGVVFKNLRVNLTWSLSIFDCVHYRLISVFFLLVVCVCQVFGKPFHEYTHAEEGEAVMGKEYVDEPFDTTINSVPEPNPSRDWESLDVENEPNPNY